MKRKPILAIIIEGGVVQGIVSDAPGFAADAFHAIITIDYDRDGDRSEMQLIQQAAFECAGVFVAPEPASAYVGSWGVEQATIDLEKVLEEHYAE